MRGADLFLGLSAKGDMERRGKPRILRRLHGHGRALAEVAVERETVASRAGDFHEACPQQYFLARQYRVYLRSRIKRGAPALSSREDRSLRHQAILSEQAIEDCDGPYRVPGFPLDPARPSYWPVGRPPAARARMHRPFDGHQGVPEFRGLSIRPRKKRKTRASTRRLQLGFGFWEDKQCNQISRFSASSLQKPAATARRLLIRFAPRRWKSSLG